MNGRGAKDRHITPLSIEEDINRQDNLLRARRALAEVVVVRAWSKIGPIPQDFAT
jgi:hypothetical protein